MTIVLGLHFRKHKKNIAYWVVSHCPTGMNEENEECSVLRTPLRSLTGHHGVVIAADWLPGGEQAVTAGWDRLACIWDTQTGQLLHQVNKCYYII